MAAPRPPHPRPTPPPQVFTNHAPQHGKPEPPPPPDQLIRQRRAVMRGYDKQGRAVVGPDLDMEGRGRLVGRQSWNTSYPTCDDVGNNVLACYPTQGLTLVESDWTKFVWNLRQPQFIGAGTVDVYLFHADSNEMALSFLGQQNAAGQLGVQVDDTWWGDRGDTFDGSNVTFPYYFVVVPGGTTLTGGESRLATFLAIQTATPATLVSASSASVASVAAQASLASVSLTSVAAASSSLASLSSESIESIISFSSALTTLSELSVASPAAFSSLSAESTASAASLSSLVSISQSSVFSSESTQTASRTANSTFPPGSTQTGDLQGASGENGNTPAWAIAVPVVLGVLALIFLCALLYFAARYFRWRRAALARRGSMGSQSPMMENIGDPASKPPKPPSPALGGGGAEVPAAVAAAVGAAALSRDTSTATTHPHGEPVQPATGVHNPHVPLAAASDPSRSGSGASPFSGVDAEIMARAFREALHKPVFPAPVEEGSSGPHSSESVPQVGADSASASKDEHGTDENGGGFARVGQIVQEEGGRVGRVGEQSVRVQGPPSGEG